jgi:hypothetical protein
VNLYLDNLYKELAVPLNVLNVNFEKLIFFVAKLFISLIKKKNKTDLTCCELLVALGL